MAAAARGVPVERLVDRASDQDVLPHLVIVAALRHRDPRMHLLHGVDVWRPPKLKALTWRSSTRPISSNDDHRSRPHDSYVNASRASTVGELIDELEASLRALHLSDAHALHSDLEQHLGDGPSVGMSLLDALAAMTQMNDSERAADAVAKLEEGARQGDLPRRVPPRL